jgi:anti-sigma regulatory factor (Ser/Thr protein kinase)
VQSRTMPSPRCCYCSASSSTTLSFTAGPDGWVRVAIVRSTDHLHVEVRDDGPGFAWRAQPRVDEDDPGGFGLLLIERLAARWGVVRDEAGTAVWFDYGI